MPTTDGLRHSARFLPEYAWSSRTNATRSFQWRASVFFCADEDRTVLTVTDAHRVSFMGWLAAEREAGRRAVSSTSIPQYLSAVRQMQRHALGVAVPDFPLVTDVARAYARWEDDKFPQLEVSCGAPA